MTITSHTQIVVSDIVIELVRKDIKNLHLAVYPPDGRVRVSAPNHLDDESIRLAVLSRLSWIHRQQDAFARQPRQSERAMVTGESHYFRGRRYQLSVVEHPAPPLIRIANNRTLELRVRPDASRDKREAVLREWYRQALKRDIPPLIAKWAPRMEVDVASFGVKRMKTRWGSCNISTRRVWLNLELAKKPATCLEYVVVHEMVHLLERRHNDRFKAYMDRFLPKWQLFRDELNRLPLGAEDWDY